MNRSTAFPHTPLALAAAFCVAGLLSAPSARAQATSETATPTLQPVTVQGRATPAQTTEGTRSYTTEAASTATGLSLSLRETPQSVTVVTRERMNDQALASVKEVVDQTTGVMAQELDSARYSFKARGFDITNLQVDGIASTWEGAWTAGQHAADTALFDRVEVVRGATGLLTGAGNPSAAINMVRKRAQSKVFAGEVNLGLGTDNETNAMVDLSTPFNAEGSVRGRFVGSLRKKDSYRNAASEESSLFYGTVAADLTPATTFTVGASQQTDDPKNPTWGGLPSWYTDGGRTAFDRGTSTSANWTRFKSENQTVFAELAHRLDNDWRLRAIAQHSEVSGDARLLYVFGDLERNTGLGLSGWPGYYLTTRKQEDLALQASGPFSAFGRSHEVTVGFQHSKQKFNADSRSALNWPTIGNFFQWTGDSPEPAWGPVTPYESFNTTQTGFYAATRLSITDPLKLILGARASEWKRDGIGYDRIAYASKHDKVTPYAGLIYDINDTYSAFASYTSIFNPQELRDRNGRYLDPVEGESKEVGLKAEYFGGRLNAGLTVFQIDQDKLGQPDTGYLVPGTNPPAQAYRAAEGTRSRGYEIDVSGELTEGLNLSVGWAQFKARDALGEAVNPSHPRKVLKVFGTYRLPGMNKLVLGGGVNWVSSHYGEGITPAGTVGRITQPSYTLLNLMARYEFTPQTSLQLNIDNATDEKHYSQVGFFSQYSWAEPRSVLLTLKHSF
jgi:outer membrane receptor for ferric coprogen and ferric-rhodotorulic acid